MNDEQYIRIAAAGDRLLSAPGVEIERLAIGPLHVIHEHPSWLAQYRCISEPESRPAWRDRAPFLQLRDALRIARAIGRSARTSGIGEIQSHTNDAPDVLIISRLSNRAQLHEQGDFYFGAMPELLRARGASVVLAHVDHLPDARPRPAGLILPRTLPVRDELALWRKCAALKPTLASIAATAPDDSERKLAKLAGRQALAAGTASNLRLYARVRELCARLRPRVVITTFEGDASERMIWLGARAAHRSTLCVGYQHTRLLPRAHAIRRPIGNARLPCDPEVILTLGDRTQTLLESACNPGTTRFITYGTHRRIVNAPPAREVRPATCLVLPDAEPAECRLLFEFSSSCALRLPEIRFIFRPHPAMDLRLLRADRAAVRHDTPNLRIETAGDLHALASQARACLYRGSSAVFHAVLAGARPIYVARHGELDFDPLRDLTAWRATVTSAEQLRTRLAEPDMETGSPDAVRAWNHCNEYMAAVRPAALDELLALAPDRAA